MVVPRAVLFNSSGITEREKVLIAATSKEWLTLLFLTLGLFVLIGLADKLRSVLHWHPEFTRKFVHIATGVLIFFTPYLFESVIPLLVLSVFFIIVNFLGLHLNLFKGMHGTERPTYGTVFYPFAFLLLLLFFWPQHKVIIQLSMLILALADALAAIVGENLPRTHPYKISGDTKSLEGSLAMGVSSFLIVCLGLMFLPHAAQYHLSAAAILGISLLTAIFATVLESVSWNGSDNLTAPLGAAFILHFTLTHSGTENLTLTLGMALAFFIALGSYWVGFLSGSGAVATFLMGSFIFGIGRWEWGIPILAFFISSSILSRLWKDRKKISNLLYEKTARRDLGQVSANGGIAALIILLFYTTRSGIWYPIYLGTLAAVTADTWATELGILSRKAPRLITTFRQALPGTSGAISPIGTTGALLGGAFIGLVGYLFSPVQMPSLTRSVLLIAGAGLLASLVDSLIGATLQAQYRCPVCEKITERRTHCNGETTQFVRGHTWINNDVVNAFCALSGSLFMAAGLLLF